MHENNIESIIKAQNGDEMAYLVENNQGLIWSIVKRFLGRGYDKEDIYQIGCLGFIKAIRRFDSEFEVKLSTYAVPYILGEIKKFLRDDGPVEEITMAMEIGKPIESLENSAYNTDNSNKPVSIAEMLSTNKDEATSITDKITIHNLIENLEDRDKEIILLRYYKDKTQTEVAKILGISQVQVSRIEKKILEGMKTELVS